jgi:hypothetical protein
VEGLAGRVLVATPDLFFLIIFFFSSGAGSTGESLPLE